MVPRIAFRQLMDLPAVDRSDFIKRYDGVWAQVDTEVQRMPYSSGSHLEEGAVRHILTVELDSATAAEDMMTLRDLFPLR